MLDCVQCNMCNKTWALLTRNAVNWTITKILVFYFFKFENLVLIFLHQIKNFCPIFFNFFPHYKLAFLSKMSIFSGSKCSRCSMLVCCIPTNQYIFVMSGSEGFIFYFGQVQTIPIPKILARKSNLKTIQYKKILIFLTQQYCQYQYVLIHHW